MVFSRYKCETHPFCKANVISMETERKIFRLSQQVFSGKLMLMSNPPPFMYQLSSDLLLV